MLSINLPCLGYRADFGPDGYEYDCEYGTGIPCEDCVCCLDACGYTDPRNDKEINFLFKIIQRRRSKKYWKIKKEGVYDDIFGDNKNFSKITRKYLQPSKQGRRRMQLFKRTRK
jgi:hypothetical protein